MAFPDVSEVLRGDALLAEDLVWTKQIGEKERLAEDLCNAPFRTVLEIGCGTGLYARILQDAFSIVPIVYLGIDSNPEALDMAKARNPSTRFLQRDFRDYDSKMTWDLVCAHAFLKHFSADEWPPLFAKFLSLGRIAQFDMQTAAETFNNGSLTFGNNLWVAESLFSASLAEAGHVIKSSRIAWQQDDRKATIYLTEKCDAA
jgi:SAM-dependent methyltransferase